MMVEVRPHCHDLTALIDQIQSLLCQNAPCEKGVNWHIQAKI